MIRQCLCCVAVMVAFANAASAKRDFFVEKEVRCGVGEMCYEKANGKPLNGLLRRYYADGVKREDIRYVNGIKNGVAQQYYPDGKQQAYMVYQNGVLDGGSSIYYNSGNVKYETSYTAGVMNGKRTGYYEDGKLKSEVVYDMGKPVSANCRKEDGTRVDFTDRVNIYLAVGMTPCGAY